MYYLRLCFLAAAAGGLLALHPAAAFPVDSVRTARTTTPTTLVGVRDASLRRRAPAPVPDASSSPVTIAGGSYPRFVRLTNGMLLAMVTLYGGDGFQALQLYRSTDNGASYKSFSTAAVTHSGNDLDNGQLIQLPAVNSLGGGRLIATFRNHTRGPDGGDIFYRIGVCYSDDLGQTFPHCNTVIGRPLDGVNGLWEPFLRVGQSGQVQVYFASENAEFDQDILMATSHDRGQTWGPPITVAGANLTGRDGMPGVSSYVDLRDGQEKLICVFENTLAPKAARQGFRIFNVVSPDDGLTWENRSLLYAPTGTDNNAGSPQVATTILNEIVVSFMTDEDTQLHHWIEGADFKIVVSNAPSAAQTDFEWGGKTTVFGTQAEWPGLLSNGDGSILGGAVHNNVAMARVISFPSISTPTPSYSTTSARKTAPCSKSGAATSRRPAGMWTFALAFIGAAAWLF